MINWPDPISTGPIGRPGGPGRAGVDEIEGIALFDKGSFGKMAFFNVTGDAWDDIHRFNRFDGAAEFHDNGNFALADIGYEYFRARQFNGLLFGFPVAGYRPKDDNSQGRETPDRNGYRLGRIVCI